MDATVHIRVTGRVQMVMFRDYTKRKARRLGISGWVRNLPDGSVEILAKGETKAIEALVTHVSVGPVLARVDGVDVTRHTDIEPLPSPFKIRLE